MHISFNRPTSIVWSIFSTHGGTSAFVTSSAYLNDGKVAIPTRITLDAGTQTTSVYTAIHGALSLRIYTGDLVVIAVLFPKTAYAVPAGVLTQVELANIGGGPGTFARTVTFNNGATGVIAVIPVTGVAGAHIDCDHVQVKVFNDLASATWAASGQTIDVGEIWCGTLQEFKTSADPKIALLGGPTERRSHNNTPQPLMTKPYRQMQTELVPFSDAVAYSAANNFEQVRYALATTAAGLFIPRLFVRGTTTVVDQAAVNQQTIFGRPAVNAFGPMTGVRDAAGLWTASLTVEESPP